MLKLVNVIGSSFWRKSYTPFECLRPEPDAKTRSPASLSPDTSKSQAIPWPLVGLPVALLV
ncbi:hypothetical protein SK128_017450 [Halocaridina rubra]|uniref:Uncharacterized protein n=1 Tax=Halocaridina rubra TaxID=373956 RepID=A0AAN8WQ54_HALRR